MSDQSVGDKAAACPRCGTDAKLRPRSFSDQALAALVAWHELDRGKLGHPVCDNCYEELREVLIDREDELVAASTSKPMPAGKPAPAIAPRPAPVEKPMPVAGPRSVATSVPKAKSAAATAKDKREKEAEAPKSKKDGKGRGVKIAG